MKTAKALVVALGILISLLAAKPGQAAPSDSGGRDEMKHFLSVGGGVSSPSVTSSLSENPAGLAYNRRVKLLAAVGTESDNFNPLGVQAGVLLGNGTVGAGLVYQQFINGNAGVTNLVHLLDFGLAANFNSLNLSLGISGTYTIYQKGASGGLWGLNTGLLFNPNGKTRFGITAYNVVNSLDAVGLGVATDINQWATLSLDGAASKSFTGKIVKPGLGISLDYFQMAVGYGIKIDNLAGTWIRDGASLAIGFRVSDRLLLQFYYNQIAKYYAGLTLRM